MSLITLRDLGMTLSAPLFFELNLSVNAGDRIGLVAANGRGKSSLLRILAGEDDATTGTVTRSDLDAESSAVFSTVIWLIVRGIYPGVDPRVNFVGLAVRASARLQTAWILARFCAWDDGCSGPLTLVSTHGDCTAGR